MPHQVFIGHATEDRAVAERVCSSLEEAGLTCWIAPRDIPPGQSYAAGIVTAIREARHFILIFSHHANASPHVENEVERAFSQHLAIHPLRLEPAELSPELEYFLSRPQWFDLFGGPLDERIQQFARAFIPIATRASPQSASRPSRSSVASPAVATVAVNPPSPRRARRGAEDTVASREGAAPVVKPAVHEAPMKPLSRIVPESIRVVRALSGLKSAVRCVAISPDGELIASGCQGGTFTDHETLHLWRARDGKLLRTFKEQTNGVEAVAFSPDGSLLASGDQFGVTVWTVNKGTRAHDMGASFVNALAFSPDGRWLASGSHPDVAEKEAGLDVWRVGNGKLLRSLPGHSTHVAAVAFSPTGTVLASGSQDRSVRLWNPADGRLIDTLSDAKQEVSRLVFLPGGESLLLACGDKGMKIWDLGTRAIRKFSPGRAAALALSPCASIVATSYSDPEIQFWRLADGKLIRTVEGPRRLLTTNTCHDLSFTPDGKTLVSAWEDKLVRIWALA